MNRWIKAAAAGAIVFTLFTGTCSAAGYIDSGISERTKEEIAEKWKRTYPSAYHAYPFLQAPLLTESAAWGKLNRRFLDGGLARLNYHRYIAGLSDDVVLSEALTETAQKVSVTRSVYSFSPFALSRGAVMTHSAPEAGKLQTVAAAVYNFPAYLVTRNTFSSPDPKTALIESIDRGMGITPDPEKERLYDRSFLLYPTLKEVGFGMAPRGGIRNFSHVAMYNVLNEGTATAYPYNYVAYPARGYFPADDFPSSSPWTVILNDYVFKEIENPEQISIEVKRLSDGMIWGHTKKLRNLKDVTISSSFIAFRPDVKEPFAEDEEFRVTISGLTKMNDEKATSYIDYYVRFFYIHP